MLPIDPKSGCWLGIAFRRGDPCRLKDRLIMSATSGEFVHTEVLLGSGARYHAYAAFEGRGGFLRSGNRHDPDHWDVLALPLSTESARAVYSTLLQALDMNLSYNYTDLWQCVIQSMLPYEADLDCEDMPSWRRGGLFCSQAALLFLRRFLRSGLVPPGSLSPATRLAIEQTHSRGCSPNLLHRLLLPSQKNRA